MTRAGDTTYRYDEAGRLLSRTKRRLSRKPEFWRYMWDAEDRLTSCTTPDGQVWHYRYGPLGRRTAKYHLADDGSTAVDEILVTWTAPASPKRRARSPASPSPGSTTATSRSPSTSASGCPTPRSTPASSPSSPPGSAPPPNSSPRTAR
ncbi:RHS repeat domain-containing protein [Streptomyces sp. NPDC001939]